MLAGSVLCYQKFSCKWNLLFFKAVPTNRLPFYLGSLLHIISSLFSHFRSWDYLENFGIYSQLQLDRKSKTWFFTFLNVYVSWIKQGKILISQFSPSKFRCFADQNRSKGNPVKTNFDNKCKNEVPKQLGLEKQMNKMGLLVLFSYFAPELWPLNF